jgi:hypothetical protein
MILKNSLCFNTKLRLKIRLSMPKWLLTGHNCKEKLMLIELRYKRMRQERINGFKVMMQLSSKTPTKNTKN